MLSLGIHYYPLTLPFLLILLVGLVALTSLAVLRVLQFAYSQLGIAPKYFFTWLFLSLAGSYVNLPIMRFSPEQMTRLVEIPFYGVPYVIPTVETWPDTLLERSTAIGLPAPEPADEPTTTVAPLFAASSWIG